MLVENGIVNLTSWLGNVILPTLSGLFFAFAIIRFVGPGQHQNWMYAGLLCLMTSGILRALEFFSSQQSCERNIALVKKVVPTAPIRYLKQ